MASAALIRTNGLEDISSIRKQLLEYFDTNDIYVLIEDFANDSYDTYRGVDNSLKVGKKFLEENNLQYFKRAGWQCGDYMLYAARMELEKKYDYYWIVEPDLRLNINVPSFFKKLEGKTEDLIGIYFGYRKNNWGWYGSMSFLYPEKVSGLYFPFLRVSAQAVDFLLKKRVEYGRLEEIRRLDFTSNSLIKDYANDEAFVASTLRNNGFNCIAVNDFSEDLISGYFSTEFPISELEEKSPYLKNKIAHPVLSNWDRIFSKLGLIYKKYPAEIVNKRVNEMISNESISNEVKLKLKTYLRPNNSLVAIESNEISTVKPSNLISNELLLQSKDGSLKKVQDIDGLKVEFLGQNNEIVISSQAVLHNVHLKLGDDCKVHIGKTHKRGVRNTFVDMSGAKGGAVFIDDETSIESARFAMANESGCSVKIGRNCMLSSNIMFRATDGHVIHHLGERKALNRSKPIHIGDSVWIGSGVTILKGTQVANDSIIGTMSLVASRFENPNIVIGGNPARVIKTGIAWDRTYLKNWNDE
ncbi:acyltransferase [Psychrobacter sp.]|uniref:acyltransferase n=1 Tax=Psychrobacter sp. TaxID=56811 RepID=UPI003F947A89